MNVTEAKNLKWYDKVYATYKDKDGYVITGEGVVKGQYAESIVTTSMDTGAEHIYVWVEHYGIMKPLSSLCLTKIK